MGFAAKQCLGEASAATSKWTGLNTSLPQIRNVAHSCPRNTATKFTISNWVGDKNDYNITVGTASFLPTPQIHHCEKPPY